MTQIYYTKKILPDLIAEIQRFRLTLPEYRGDIILQEDNDPSHGHRSGLEVAAIKLREANWITTLKHPAQSPDLSSYQGSLGDSKTAYAPETIEELKAALREE